ncbi:hypothetical protein ANTQUA_LOCUS7039 [Anthophora quadrimaculata]
MKLFNFDFSYKVTIHSSSATYFEGEIKVSKEFLNFKVDLNCFYDTIVDGPTRFYLHSPNTPAKSSGRLYPT